MTFNKSEVKTMTAVRVNEPERWLGVEEIAAHIGCSKDSVRAWIKNETIPYHKVGRQYKFRISEVDAWIESGESANADKKPHTGGSEK